MKGFGWDISTALFS